MSSDGTRFHHQFTQQTYKMDHLTLSGIQQPIITTVYANFNYLISLLSSSYALILQIQLEATYHWYH